MKHLTFAANGVLGESALLLVVVESKHEHTSTLTVCSAANLALTAMVICSSVNATLKCHALWIAKESGVSTAVAPPVAVAESNLASTRSLKKHSMVEKRAPKQTVLLRTTHAAQSSARCTARVIGRIGANAPMEVLDLGAWNVVQEACSIEITLLTLITPQVAVNAKPRCLEPRSLLLWMSQRWTPAPVSCLAAQSLVRVPGASGASAQART